MKPRPNGGRVADSDERGFEVSAKASLGEGELDAVTMAVDADLVAARRDLGRDSRITLDMLAGQEEGRPHTRPSESCKHGRRATWVGPAVEGERDAGCAVHRSIPAEAAMRDRTRASASSTSGSSQ